MRHRLRFLLYIVFVLITYQSYSQLGMPQGDEKATSNGGVYIDNLFDYAISNNSIPYSYKEWLLAKLRAGEYKGVIVYKLDRWARSSTELILEVNELIGKGIDFFSYSDNLDFSTATGQLHFQILSAFAQFERSLISERTKEGLRRAKMQGKSLGHPVGSKDKKRRKRSGYLLKEASKRQKADNNKGNYNSIEKYL